MLRNLDEIRKMKAGKFLLFLMWFISGVNLPLALEFRKELSLLPDMERLLAVLHASFLADKEEYEAGSSSLREVDRMLQTRIENKDDLERRNADTIYFHSSCVKQWLLYKNLCPICKSTASKREAEKEVFV